MHLKTASLLNSTVPELVVAMTALSMNQIKTHRFTCSFWASIVAYFKTASTALFVDSAMPPYL
jgi:hypothetical protein